MRFWLHAKVGTPERSASDMGVLPWLWQSLVGLCLGALALVWSGAERRLASVLMDGQLSLGLWLLVLFFVLAATAGLVFGGAYLWLSGLRGLRWRPSGLMLGIGVSLALAVFLHLSWFRLRDVDVWAPLVFSKFSCAWLILGAQHSGPDRLRLVCAAWLLSCLGFSLGLVSSQPVLAMSAGESLILVAVLLVLFKVFSVGRGVG